VGERRALTTGVVDGSAGANPALPPRFMPSATTRRLWKTSTRCSRR
jgi:hypothetical protein